MLHRLKNYFCDTKEFHLHELQLVASKLPVMLPHVTGPLGVFVCLFVGAFIVGLLFCLFVGLAVFYELLLIKTTPCSIYDPDNCCLF